MQQQGARISPWCVVISSGADVSRLVLMHVHPLPVGMQAEISPEGGAARTGLVAVVSTSNSLRLHTAGDAAAA
jgi:hypothetical protein